MLVILSLIFNFMSGLCVFFCLLRKSFRINYISVLCVFFVLTLLATVDIRALSRWELTTCGRHFLLLQSAHTHCVLAGNPLLDARHMSHFCEAACRTFGCVFNIAPAEHRSCHVTLRAATRCFTGLVQ